MAEAVLAVQTDRNENEWKSDYFSLQGTIITLEAAGLEAKALSRPIENPGENVSTTLCGRTYNNYNYFRRGDLQPYNCKFDRYINNRYSNNDGIHTSQQKYNQTPEQKELRNYIKRNNLEGLADGREQK